jgi:hypothetical protein
MSETKKPFSSEYVIRTTAKHMRKCVDISLKKTVERINEFDGDVAMGHEIFVTLAKLHNMRKQLDDFQHQNPEIKQGQ